MDDLLISAKLSAQRALLGMVEPYLRAVVVDVAAGKVTVRLIIDGPLRESSAGLASEIEAEMQADYHQGAEVVVRVERLDYPAPVSAIGDGCFVYARRESGQG